MIKTTLTIIIFIYILIGYFLYEKQRDFLYFPKKNTIHKGKDIFINNGLCNIHTIIINEGKKDAIIYFGGNAETISKSTDYIKKQFPNHTSYLMNYPGYGLSTDYIKEKHNKISVGGRSLGSGVATHLASKRKIHKLVLITPYYSILSIAQKKYPIYPINLLLKDKFLSGENVKNFKTKTLLAIAEKDTLIKMENTKKLIKNFPKEQLEILIIKGANHSNISESEEYFNKVKEFIEK